MPLFFAKKMIFSYLKTVFKSKPFIPKVIQKLVFGCVGYATNLLLSLAPCACTMVARSKQKICAAALPNSQLLNHFRYISPSTKRGCIPKIQTQGQYHNLQDIYDVLNQDYFQNKLDLKITWFSSPQRKAKRHRKLGLFCFQTNRIKIHRVLDQPYFPAYFISYVVYHEMLHSVCPPIKVKRGKYRIHHPNFKSREKEFADFAVAKNWERENKKLFFS